MNVRKISGFMAVCAIIMFGFLSIRALPVETDRYIAKKYAGWSGVLRCWICADFSCDGSFNAWLNSCASAFERAHPGVYIEIESVSPSVMASRADALLPPDMIFYSPSTSISEHLTNVTLLALGGMIGITRSGEIFDPAQCAIGGDPNRDAAAAAILTGDGSADRIRYIEDIGIDLGLTAQAVPAMTADEALQAFLSGEYPCIIATSAQLAKLIDRRDRGLEPDWACANPDIAFTDQLLLGAACCDGEKRDLCGTYLAHLLREENQRALSKIGAHSPILRIYPDSDPRAAIDAALHRADRIVRGISAPPTSCADILRLLKSGDIDLVQAQHAVTARYT